MSQKTVGQLVADSELNRIEATSALWPVVQGYLARGLQRFHLSRGDEVRWC